MVNYCVDNIFIVISRKNNFGNQQISKLMNCEQTRIFQQLNIYNKHYKSNETMRVSLFTMVLQVHSCIHGLYNGLLICLCHALIHYHVLLYCTLSIVM